MTPTRHSAGGRWRPMSAADLAAVGDLANWIYPDYPEEDAVFAERLSLYPAGCMVFEQGLRIAAYVVSHPWRHTEPPALNMLLGALPREPSTFYIHDLALSPEARGTGAAAEAVALLVNCAHAAGLPSMSLIAVNGSAGFWQRQGFAAVDAPLLGEKLRSYADDAQFMMRSL